ncbi:MULTISPECIES: pyridoxamine 5'-phosphate oxidase family protein [Haloferax]|uniref:Pyridoxamine 5'-phosphate oxidase n=1 Tax=Haloferax massiliensis TaxID=1476858 RepID=A0A0D6JPJ2_9EURY|nr:MULTISPECIES: pyridoxamine 5'-phosphate oxidase family protein [Haloferax]MDS0239717.1 pyridoxamine 5'-phosphate oxidase family protein [Haloferax sp. S2CR25]MDS0442838.1 pyridoxamine 5'-phosphate oxidase family protein [Haloferax sp. S2CR25-2]CQR49799.1 Pyridoxamine 5'-phosphate oxidase [Haloferax massiliensis]
MPDDAPPATTRDRPETEASYGIPDSKGGLLEWRVVEAAFADGEVFWVATTRPDGRPHARPVWGVWVDGAFHCGGGERTRWVRNLARDPRLAVHTESGTDVVILEGVAERLDAETADEATLARVDDAYEAKYGIRHGTPVFRIRPERVLAWSGFPADATRWRFDSA